MKTIKLQWQKLVMWVHRLSFGFLSIHVTAVNIISEKVDQQLDYIEKYLTEKLDLTATLDAKAAYSGVDAAVIADSTKGTFGMFC